MRKMNKDKYSVYRHGDDMLVWMGINELNVLSYNEGAFLYEYALWLRGVKKWCKNVIIADITSMETVIDAVVEVRRVADTLEEIDEDQ